MSQNMYCSNQKTSNEKYRKGYDSINWKSDKRNEKNEDSSDTTSRQTNHSA
jgi:hypothetical protein